MAKTAQLYAIFEEYTNALNEKQEEDKVALAQVRQKELDCTLTRDVVSMRLEMTRNKCMQKVRALSESLQRCEKIEKNIAEIKKLFKSVTDE